MEEDEDFEDDGEALRSLLNDPDFDDGSSQQKIDNNLMDLPKFAGVLDQYDIN